MADTAERLTVLIRDSYPYAFCYACLATKFSETEMEVRNAAQLVAIARPGFVISRRVCEQCRTVGDFVTFHLRRA